MIRKIALSLVFLSAFILTFSSFTQESTSPYVLILGIAQDAGYPHPGCKKVCCYSAWRDLSRKRMVTSLALVDPISNERWIFDATPDFPAQLQMLNRLDQTSDTLLPNSSSLAKNLGISGIFLTHAHIGHYTGLMYLGRESISSNGLPVFVMPRMREFLLNNGPWRQLVSLHNIELFTLTDGKIIHVNERISVKPILVPHRDEYSETVGYIIKGPRKSLLFIPDIDKWEKWETDIEDIISTVDYAFLDGTFYQDGEIPGRAMAEIPHPFVTESLSRFARLSEAERSKIWFIHFNHTNPVMHSNTQEREYVKRSGFNVAEEQLRFGL